MNRWKERTTERAGAAERPQESGVATPGRGGRMSRQRKTAAVLRLLRGEDLETVSRSLGVTAATLTNEAFLAAGEAALATRPTDGETLESERLKVRLGEMLLAHELLEQKITTLESGRPLARRRWKR
jgi:transposase